jgi:hypothetical protein
LSLITPDRTDQAAVDKHGYANWLVIETAGQTVGQPSHASYTWKPLSLPPQAKYYSTRKSMDGYLRCRQPPPPEIHFVPISPSTHLSLSPTYGTLLISWDWTRVPGGTSRKGLIAAVLTAVEGSPCDVSARWWSATGTAAYMERRKVGIYSKLHESQDEGTLFHHTHPSLLVLLTRTCSWKGVLTF